MKKRFALKLSCLIIGGLILLAPFCSVSADQTKAKVMSRNLYVGGNVFRVIEAATNPDPQPLDIPIAVAELFEIITYTNFAERVESITDEIRKNRPHLIGLQEVAIILMQEPGDFTIGNPNPATDVVFDYLEILIDSIKKKKLKYEVAVVVSNADIELPMLAGFTPQGAPILNDVRLIDQDVILVRKDIKYWNSNAKNYDTKISLPVGGSTIDIVRGFTALDAEIGDIIYRFVNTHLEVAGGTDDIFSAVQAAQMLELLTILTYESKPILLAGDLNSDPDDNLIQSQIYGLIVPPYLQAIGAGFVDVWYLTKKPEELTCCFNETVDDPEASLYERIDHILIKTQDELIPKRARVKATGDRMRDMTVNGFWPSDHAGVFAKIKFREID